MSALEQDKLVETLTIMFKRMQEMNVGGPRQKMLELIKQILNKVPENQQKDILSNVAQAMTNLVARQDLRNVSIDKLFCALLLNEVLALKSPQLRLDAKDVKFILEDYSDKDPAVINAGLKSIIEKLYNALKL